MENNVLGEVFTYQRLKEKAEREIARLDRAEQDFDEYVLDYALNAAFSIFHLLEWRDKTTHPTSQKGAFELLKETNNDALKALHDVTTFNKHARIGSPQSKAKIVVKASAKAGYLTLEDNSGFLLTEDGHKIMLENSRLVVKFDNQKALDILRNALDEFKGN